PDSHFQLNVRREHNLACIPRSASRNVYQHFCKVFARKASNQSKPRTENIIYLVTSTKCSFGFFDFTTQFLYSSVVFADILALLLLI
ncbi:hypothetical protein ALC56_05389, partial [Trachymyrmex septentrionalis]